MDKEKNKIFGKKQNEAKNETKLLKINRYRLKDGITEDDISKYHLKPGGHHIAADAGVFIWTSIGPDISLDVGFPKDLSKWDDFNYVTVFDEDFGQPYLPFYKYLDGTEANNVSPFLRRVIKNYNKVMDSYDFLEKTDGKDMKDA
jgi:hypothetical protein